MQIKIFKLPHNPHNPGARQADDAVTGLNSRAGTSKVDNNDHKYVANSQRIL